MLAYLSAQFPLLSETFVWREVRELRRRGHVVHTFGLRGPEHVPAELGDLRDTTRDVYALPAAFAARSQPWQDITLPGESMSLKDRGKLLAQWSAGSRLARVLQAERVTHLHIHFAHAPATVGMYAAMIAGIPFSFTGHANDLFQRRALLKRKLQRASFVSCISEWHRKLYQSIESRDDASYPVIRCGVALNDDEPQARPAEAGLSHPLRVLTVGRLVEKKGIDTLVRGLPQDAHLTIAGDGPMRGELEALAAGKHVTFLGSVSNDRVHQLLRETDVFALPCRVDRNGDKDGIPVVLMEAMAAAVPVVAGDLEAIRELVKHDQTGLLVDGTQPAEVAAAMGRLADPSLRESLGQRGRDRVTQEFSIGVNVDRLEQHFNA